MNKLENVLKVLYSAAMEAKNNDEIPVAAVIVDKNMNIIAKGINNRQKECNVLGHAEINAILEAEKYINDWRLNGYDMYVSLEPCHMCNAVINESRLDRVFFVCSRDDEKYFPGNNIKLDDSLGYEVKFKELLTTFFDNMR